MGNRVPGCCKEQTPDVPSVSKLEAEHAELVHNHQGYHQKARAPVKQEKAQVIRVFLTHNWGIDKEGRDNHARVKQLNAGLKQKGIVTWFDEQGDMKGEIVQAMTGGIDESDVVIVCVTRAYIEKCKKQV